MQSARIASTLAGLWAGSAIGIGFVAAPVVFAVVARPLAGLVAGRLFAVEGALSLGFGAVLLWLLRRGRLSGAQRPDAALWLAMAAVFCTVAGQYALQPLMAATRAGDGPVPFAAVHGVASLLYGLKTLLTIALTWRVAAQPDRG